MDRISYEKISERMFTSGTKTYYGIIGREKYNASIKLEMLDDLSNRHWIRFSQDANGEENKTQLVPRVENSLQANYYTSRFWQYKILSNGNSIIDAGDENLFIIVGGSGWLNVKEFSKLNEVRVGEILSKYFFIKVEEKELEWWEEVLQVVFKALSDIFNFNYRLLDAIPGFHQIMTAITKLVNNIFGSEMKTQELFELVLQIVIVIVLTFFSFGTATVLALQLTSMAASASKAQREAEEAEQNQKDQSKKDKEQKEKEAEDEKRRESEVAKDSNDEREDFEAFLKNPLYLEDKKMKLIDNKQFELL
jgi:Sec-independent protein translocase protein TatA